MDSSYPGRIGILPRSEQQSHSAAWEYEMTVTHTKGSDVKVGDCLVFGSGLPLAILAWAPVIVPGIRYAQTTRWALPIFDGDTYPVMAQAWVAGAARVVA